ncbi:MAG: hypothetical protein LVS60_07185 [Nodosilinea sp. LVE1205-7]
MAITRTLPAAAANPAALATTNPALVNAPLPAPGAIGATVKAGGRSGPQ